MRPNGGHKHGGGVEDRFLGLPSVNNARLPAPWRELARRVFTLGQFYQRQHDAWNYPN